MVNPERLQNLLQVKAMELNALLELTQSINANVPETDLYKIFRFTLMGNLSVGTLALFAPVDGLWQCKVKIGNLSVPEGALPDFVLTEKKDRYAIPADAADAWQVFEWVHVVRHKEKELAYLFLSGTGTEEEDVSFLSTFTNILMVAIENKRMAREEISRQALEREMEIARDLQLQLLPKVLPNSSKRSLYTTYIPHHGVGGDYFDYIELDDQRFVLAIADVSGKGVPAALLMSNVQATLRSVLHFTQDLCEITRMLNKTILTTAGGERFVTLFLAFVDQEKQVMHYVNAGHNPILLYSQGKGPLELSEGCTILGMFETLPLLHQASLPLDATNLLILYTDGVTETMNNKYEEYGEERLLALLNSLLATPAEMHPELLKALDAHRQEMPYQDDITFLTCRLRS
jgi:sigma-B regulation protein RsbU (phosphoserine phosphatase)